MAGESGLLSSLTAFTKTRRPLLVRSRAARPGEKPPRCVRDSTTRSPKRPSIAARIRSGSSSQWTRTPSAGGAQYVDTPPQLQVVVGALLNRVAYLVRECHHEVLIVRRFRGVLLDVDRRMELDAPLARERNQAQGSEPGPERGHREVRQAK